MGTLEAYVEIAEPAQGRVLVLQLEQVDAFRHILTSMSRAAR